MSPEQAAFLLWCQLNDVPYAVARSVEETIAVLDGWGVWRGTVKAQ